MPFLSLLDDRAKPKGSRDPLGFEMVWSNLGRRLVGNLTTITSSLDNFAVALIGFAWAHELVANYDGEDRLVRLQEAFLRYEQFAAHARFCAGGQEILGITRVRKRAGGEAAIPVGRSADAQILSDQLSYGLWGLYSSALRDTGLVEGDERQPSAEGLDLVERFAAVAPEVKDHFIAVMQKDQTLEREYCTEVGRKYLAMIRDQQCSSELGLRMLRGKGRGNDLQAELLEATHTLLSEPGQATTQMELQDFVRELLTNAESHALRQRLNDIQATERVLVAANNLFHFLQRSENWSLDGVAEHFEEQGVDHSHLPERLPGGAIPRRDQLERIRECLAVEAIAEAADAVLELNHAVMQDRGGGAWVRRDSDGRIHVKVPLETGRLRTNEDLRTLWDYDYFLASFLAVAQRHRALTHG